MSAWLTKAGRYRVEHVPCPHPGERITTPRPKGILHTVEGSLESGLNVFRQHYAPHFLVGRDARGKVRILQLVPLGYMATALLNAPGGVETNREATVQIEIAGFSKNYRWLPSGDVTAALAALMRELQRVAKIPLVHVAVRRDPRLWEHTSGWYGHIDVPENTHWDPGELNYYRLLRLARSDPPSTKKHRKKPRRLDRVRTYRLVRRANGLVYVESVGCPTSV